MIEITVAISIIGMAFILMQIYTSLNPDSTFFKLLCLGFTFMLLWSSAAYLVSTDATCTNLLNTTNSTTQIDPATNITNTYTTNTYAQTCTDQTTQDAVYWTIIWFVAIFLTGLTIGFLYYAFKLIMGTWDLYKKGEKTFSEAWKESRGLL